MLRFFLTLPDSLCLPKVVFTKYSGVYDATFDELNLPVEAVEEIKRTWQASKQGWSNEFQRSAVVSCTLDACPKCSWLSQWPCQALIMKMGSREAVGEAIFDTIMDEAETRFV